MAKVKVNGGVCGFITEIEAATEDMQNVNFNITSQCAIISKMAEAIDVVDAYNELGAGQDGAIMAAARNAAGRGCCTGCIVASGVFRAMQVSAGLALPAEAAITFED